MISSFLYEGVHDSAEELGAQLVGSVLAEVWFAPLLHLSCPQPHTEAVKPVTQAASRLDRCLPPSPRPPGRFSRCGRPEPGVGTLWSHPHTVPAGGSAACMPSSQPWPRGPRMVPEQTRDQNSQADTIFYPGTTQSLRALLPPGRSAPRLSVTLGSLHCQFL